MNPYTEAFLIAIEILLDHEGGYVNNPKDPGGETKYGISKRSYPNEDIKNMTKARAMEIYWEDFWGPSLCDNMKLALSIQMLDAAVNHGIPRAKKLLQQALGVEPDGIVGKITLRALNVSNLDDMLLRYLGYRTKYFISLSTFSTFGKGWIDRIANNLILSAKYN